jgi:hypothetical protein
MYSKGNGNEEFGFSEALLITKDKIFIGMDSGSNTEVRPWFIENFEKKGAKKGAHPAVILIFERPLSF